MPGLHANLTAAERIICAIDTSDKKRARDLAKTAKDAGAWVIKLGLEFASATSWRECSDLAASEDLEWVADAKLKDIPATVANTAKNLVNLPKPPVAITIHTTTGVEALQAAQYVANEADVMLLGVTHLTSIGAEETMHYSRLRPSRLVQHEALRAKAGGIGGLVCSGLEVNMIKTDPRTKHLFTMIPGTRSAGTDKADQERVVAPEDAIYDGADLLVIGRQISGAADPAVAYQELINEINQGLERRAT